MPRGLQEWIHLIEEGEWKSYVKLATLFLGLLGLTVVYDVREYQCFSTAEAMEMASIGRNIAEGKGFVTQSIRPFVIEMLQKKAGAEGAQILGPTQTLIPDLTYPPVYPYLLGGLMKAVPMNFGISVPQGGFVRYNPELAIAILNQVFLYLGIVLGFFLARRLFDRSVAWLTAVLMAAASLLWDFTLSGLPTLLLLDLFLVVCWLLVLLDENGRNPKHGTGWVLLLAAASGGAVGVGCLTVYSFGWLLIPVAVALAAECTGRRFASVVTALLLFAAVVSPWLVRNYQTGQTILGTAGYSILQGTTAFPDDRLERTLNSANFERGANTIGVHDYFRKLMVNTSEIVQRELPTLAGSWITGLFLAGMLIPFRNPALSRLRYFIVASLVVLVLVEALGRTHLTSDHPVINSENLLVILCPLVFMFGVGLFYMVTDLIEFPIPQLRFLLTVAFTLLMSAPMVFRLLPPRKPSVCYPPYYPPIIQETAQSLKPTELMMSDMPWAIAWYGERSCVWLTLDAPMDSKYSVRGDFFSINDFQKPIQGLYLTPLTTDLKFLTEMIRKQDGVWGRFLLDSLLRTNISPVFPLQYARAKMLPEQLFLTDRPRWKVTAKR